MGGIKEHHLLERVDRVLVGPVLIEPQAAVVEILQLLFSGLCDLLLGVELLLRPDLGLLARDLNRQPLSLIPETRLRLFRSLPDGVNLTLRGRHQPEGFRVGGVDLEDGTELLLRVLRMSLFEELLADGEMLRDGSLSIRRVGLLSLHRDTRRLDDRYAGEDYQSGGAPQRTDVQTSSRARLRGDGDHKLFLGLWVR